MINIKRIISALCLIAALCLAGSNVTQSFASVSIDVTEENLIKEVIQSYFALRYDAMKSNERSDFSSVIDDQDSTTLEWLEKEENKQELEIWIRKSFNLEIIDYKFFINFITIDLEIKSATVRLVESNEVTYNVSPTIPSKMGNLEHVILLKKTEESWVINEDDYRDDTTRLLEALPIEEIYENIKNNLQGNQSSKSSSANNPIIYDNSSVPVLLSYDSLKAITYAYNNYNTVGPVPLAIRNLPGWNPAWQTSYRSYSPMDCTNFVSQAVFEGVSYIASDPNYFYPDSNH